nr:hypothetical protein [Planctomycetota bacterium]
LRTTTAEDGTWQVHGMRRDRIWTVSVEAQRRGDVSFMPFKRRLPTWPTEPLTLTLRRYVPIEGRVVTPEGRPIERFRVYLNPWFHDGGLASTRANVRLESPGKTEVPFKVNAVAGGRYELSVHPEGDFKRPEPIVVDAPATDVVIELERTYPLRGHVEGFEPGRRSRSHVISFHPEGGGTVRSSNVNSKGRFTVGNEHDVRGTLVMRDQRGLGAVLFDVHPDDGPFTLTPKPEWSLRGVIEDYPKGLRTRLSITARCGRWFSKVTINDGVFVFDALPPAPVTLEIDNTDRLQGRFEVPDQVDSSTPSIKLKYIAPDPEEDGR